VLQRRLLEIRSLFLFTAKSMAKKVEKDLFVINKSFKRYLYLFQIWQLLSSCKRRNMICRRLCFFYQTGNFLACSPINIFHKPMCEFAISANAQKIFNFS